MLVSGEAFELAPEEIARLELAPVDPGQGGEQDEEAEPGEEGEFSSGRGHFGVRVSASARTNRRKRSLYETFSKAIVAPEVSKASG